ncbi:hypothetical protein K1719_038997 [Acacia pycnantha]|nr:hypothetical protein K1719_038997 [Acacia pycnantha]
MALGISRQYARQSLEDLENHAAPVVQPLSPDVERGAFTVEEDKMIVKMGHHSQAPQRTFGFQLILKVFERLPRYSQFESDYYARRLWGQDLPIKPKYLIILIIGYDQRNNIDAAIKKFSENFTTVLFHYDGRVDEWDQFEWSKRAIHLSVQKQTKWWYAKRFLHPNIVAPYDYIFIWDEDLGLENFDAEE